MARTTQAHLDHILRVTNRKLDTDYIFSKAYGKRRLCTADQSTELSPPLGASELYRWMEALNVGVDLTNAKIEREAAEQAERERVNAMVNGYTNWETFHVQLVVDNDEALYNDRDEWIEECLDLEMSAQEMADEMEITSFYDRAIIESDLGEGFDATEVNWLELALETINDWNERQAFEAKRIKEKAIKAAEKFNNRGNE